jgi:hypothetical protein
MTAIDRALLDRLGAMRFKIKGEERAVPTGKLLAMLVRPAFIAPPNRRLVWGDWSAIEARVLPWLAASPGAEAVLDIFRASDTDKSKPDVYIMTACQMTGDDPIEMWKALKDKTHPQHEYAKYLRQAQGKVPVLSLGYGGGLGALQAMAVNYGVFLDDAKGQWVVDTWRGTNAWARQFWGRHDRDGSSGLWGAVNQAIDNPGDTFAAGRVAFVYDRSYIGGTLFCALPCGRLLTYPDIKYRTRKFKDKKTGEEIEKTALWYKKGYGYSAMWHGKIAENVTQAVAGSILRETLVALEHDAEVDLGLWMTIGHTHDEVVRECDDEPDVVAACRTNLKACMEHRPDWRLDLPLVAEITDHTYYTKALD